MDTETPAPRRSNILPWVQAARPVAHPMLFVPLLIGQAFAFHVYQQFTLSFFLYTLVFGALYQVFLLYLNDYADEAIDKTNEQFWLSGGSRVIPQGKLQRSDLILGAKVAFVLLLGLTLFIAVFLDRPWLSVLVVLATVLCWAYNLPPIQLSYRGHGEILQGLGCGVLLPLIGFYMQRGSLHELPWLALIPLYLIFHASNIITALPDYQSDKKGSKKTCPVRRGERAARTIALVLLALAYVNIMLASLSISLAGLAIITIPSSLLLVFTIQSGLLRNANVTDFHKCKQFVNWTLASQAWFLCAWTVLLLMDKSS